MNKKEIIKKKFFNEVSMNEIDKAKDIVMNRYNSNQLQVLGIVSSSSMPQRLKRKERQFDGVSFKNLTKISNFYDLKRKEKVNNNKLANDYFDDILDYIFNNEISENLKNSGLDLENNKEFLIDLIKNSIKKEGVILDELKEAFVEFND